MEAPEEPQWPPLQVNNEASLTSSPASLRRATIADPTGTTQTRLRQRRTSMVACERCRRRKIRCSGEQPCATCARFGVRCTKPEFPRERQSNAAHAALVDRVRILEARLAMVTAGSQALSPGDTIVEYRPPLSLDTDLMSPGAAVQMQELSSDVFDDLGPGIPTIQITGPHETAPTSPFKVSPAPSLVSGTSRSSTPDAYVAVSAAVPWMTESTGTPLSAGQTHMLSSGQWSSSSGHDGMLVSPESPLNQAVESRRSSTSSFGGLDQSFCDFNIQDNSFLSNAWLLEGQQDFSQIPNFTRPGLETAPTKDQAGAWADLAFDNTRLPIDKVAAKLCLEAVYGNNNTEEGISHTMISLTKFSVRMATCIVFLILCIGNKFSENFSLRGLNSCYAFAHEQMRNADFWTEHGSGQVVGLLRVLAEVS